MRDGIHTSGIPSDFKRTKSHNSQNCRTKAPGHKEEATHNNNMGENQKGKPSAWQLGAVSEHNNNHITPITTTDQSPPPKLHRAILDSGTTGHYLLPDTHCIHKQWANNPIYVTLPNGNIICSTHTAQLPFPKLPLTALQAHVFPQLRNPALLSIGVLCDAGCTVTFDTTSVKIQYNNEIVLEGSRVPPGLWTTDLQTPLQANATNSAPLKATALQHLHASLFSPTTQTWIKAINNSHFTSWPPFTAREVRKHLPKSIATTLGHLDQQRKNLRSTKWKHKPKPIEDREGIDDSNLEQEAESRTCVANLIEVNDPTSKSYSDLTRRFPIHSNQGNLYVLLIYLCDENAIMVEPLKNRSEGE
jgi:hypothetical protein